MLTSTAEAASAATCPTLRAPMLPVGLRRERRARATLMVLTGPQAGQLAAIDQRGVVVGRADDADLVVLDPSVSGHHARVARTSQGGYCVEDLGSTNGTFIEGRRVDASPLNSNDRLLLGPHVAVRFAITDEAEASLHRRLYDHSMRDPLTHVFNRRYLDGRLIAEVARALGTSTPAAALMVDVDGLKQINDRFGHLAGDRALCLTAAAILNAVRTGDCVARYGGDEFVILAQADSAEAERLAERVRRAVEGLQLGAGAEAVPITVSIGAASLSELQPTDDPTAWLDRAKAAGRNRVCTN
jgi:diguanylate cyclase (GGDEF)-like protein